MAAHKKWVLTGRQHVSFTLVDACHWQSVAQQGRSLQACSSAQCQAHSCCRVPWLMGCCRRQASPESWIKGRKRLVGTRRGNYLSQQHMCLFFSTCSLHLKGPVTPPPQDGKVAHNIVPKPQLHARQLKKQCCRGRRRRMGCACFHTVSTAQHRGLSWPCNPQM